MKFNLNSLESEKVIVFEIFRHFLANPGTSPITLQSIFTVSFSMADCYLRDPHPFLHSEINLVGFQRIYSMATGNIMGKWRKMPRNSFTIPFSLIKLWKPLKSK